MKFVSIKDLNAVMERNHHVSHLLKLAAELTQKAKLLVPIVNEDSPESLSIHDNFCMELQDIQDSLDGYADMLEEMVNDFYDKYEQK